MNEFEKRLRSLNAAKPPKDLELRLFGPEPERSSFRSLFRRPVRFGTAAAFSMAMCAMGFILALVSVRGNQVNAPLRNTEVVIKLVEQPPAQVAFGGIEEPAGLILNNASVTIKKVKEL